MAAAAACVQQLYVASIDTDVLVMTGFQTITSDHVAGALALCGSDQIMVNADFLSAIIGVPGQWDLSLEGGALISAAVLGVWFVGWAFGTIRRLIESS